MVDYAPGYCVQIPRMPKYYISNSEDWLLYTNCLIFEDQVTQSGATTIVLNLIVFGCII